MSKPQEAKEENNAEFKLHEAAEYLTEKTGKKMSSRTFERLGLSHTKKKTLTSTVEVRFWSKETLDRYAEDLTNSLEKKSFIPAIEKVGNAPVTQQDLREFAIMLVSGIQSEVKQLAPPPPPKAKKTIADIKDKLILNLKEAILLSGLSKDELTEALSTKQILGKVTEKTVKLKGNDVIVHHWKINRQSLDEFCRNYGK